MPDFVARLSDLEKRGRLRGLSLPRGIDISSNDYLGLLQHPEMRRAAIEAIESGVDVGAGGSRLLRGHHEQHALLEEEAAQFFGCEKSLYFGSGFLANLSLFTSLPTRRDTIVFDALIHASARDGIQSSLAQHVRVPHNDVNAMEQAVRSARATSDTVWIAVESLYSMDGDFAPLSELQQIALRYDAMLVVDEAHATGIYGRDGRGLTDGLLPDGLITLHTCGKALGVAGALVCAKAEVVDLLINTARPFIYSTAPSPLQALLVRQALKIVRDEPQRRQKLQGVIRTAHQIFPHTSSTSQIIPIMIGDEAEAVETARRLQENGYDVRAVRPPTVPQGTSRLRLSLNVHITKDVLLGLAQALQEIAGKEA